MGGFLLITLLVTKPETVGQSSKSPPTHSINRYRIAPFKENRKSKKKFPKKGSSVFTFSVCLSVCVSVCSRPVSHSFWPRGLIFGMNDPWDNHSKRIFLFFEILRFDLLMAIFRFFGSFLLYILCIISPRF